MALEEEEEKSDILTTYKIDIKTTVLPVAKYFTHTINGGESVSLKLVQMTGQDFFFFKSQKSTLKK